MVLTHTATCVEAAAAGHRVLRLSTGDATLVAYPDDERAIPEWVDQLEIAICMCVPPPRARPVRGMLSSRGDP